MVQAPKVNAKRPRGGETWTTPERTSRAIGRSPHVDPKLRNEGSRRRKEKVWTKP